MSIEKRILFCWFGGKEKPDVVKKCMKTWREKMPNWEILEINEDNFDIRYKPYVEEAYRLKKFAFVSDVARLWGLYTYGGIYLDTDVIVYKPLDKFLEYDFFTGFEQPHYPVTATMGAKKGNELIKEMLDAYDHRTFELKDNWEDYETNTMIMSDVLGKYIDRDKAVYQKWGNNAVFPQEVFCNRLITRDEESYTEHLMTGFWG